MRVAVLAGVWDTRAVQTIAAFASLHVAITVTTCLVAELIRLPHWIRGAAWAFAFLTSVSTVYLGWHFFVDVLARIPSAEWREGVLQRIAQRLGMDAELEADLELSLEVDA